MFHSNVYPLGLCHTCVLLYKFIPFFVKRNDASVNNMYEMFGPLVVHCVCEVFDVLYN